MKHGGSMEKTWVTSFARPDGPARAVLRGLLFHLSSDSSVWSGKCQSIILWPDWPSARLIADLALEIQGRCARLFSDLDRRAEFRIGVDTGPVMGSVLGAEHRVYNLWGDAVNMASLMAETGEPGCVQATETFYELLRTKYLFRGRGSYYTAESGELPTYLLTGRI